MRASYRIFIENAGEKIAHLEAGLFLAQVDPHLFHGTSLLPVRRWLCILVGAGETRLYLFVDFTSLLFPAGNAVTDATVLHPARIRFCKYPAQGVRAPQVFGKQCNRIFTDCFPLMFPDGGAWRAGAVFFTFHCYIPYASRSCEQFIANGPRKKAVSPG